MIIGEYSPIITEPEANNCFSINKQVIVPKTKRESIVKHEKSFISSKARDFVRRGDYRRGQRTNQNVRDFV